MQTERDTHIEQHTDITKENHYTEPDSDSAVACSIAVRSDGDIIILYQGAQIANMGQNWDTIKYARWEGYATGWTIDQAVEGAADTEYRGSVIVHNPDNDKSHFFTSGQATPDSLHRALTSGNSLDSTADTLSTPGSFDYVWGPGSRYDPTGAVASRITVPQRLTGTAGFGVEIDDDGTPAGETFTTSPHIPKVVGQDILHGISHQSNDVDVAWWASADNSDLYINTNDDSGGWGTQSNEWTATLNDLSCDVLTNDSGDIVLAITALDATTIKYHEVVLLAAGVAERRPEAIMIIQQFVDIYHREL